MSEALKAAENGAPHGTTIVAATQTAGQNRRGRSWFSPEGGGLFADHRDLPSVPPGKSASA